MHRQSKGRGWAEVERQCLLCPVFTAFHSARVFFSSMSRPCSKETDGFFLFPMTSCVLHTPLSDPKHIHKHFDFLLIGIPPWQSDWRSDLGQVGAAYWLATWSSGPGQPTRLRLQKVTSQKHFLDIAI